MVATTIYLISPWVPLSVSGSNRALYVAEKLPQYVGLALWWGLLLLPCFVLVPQGLVY